MTSTKSMFLISTFMPNWSAFSIFLNSSAGYINNFDGMQPRVRQMPPGSSLSMIAILIWGFFWIAAFTMSIAEPVPMTIMS